MGATDKVKNNPDEDAEATWAESLGKNLKVEFSTDSNGSFNLLYIFLFIKN